MLSILIPTYNYNIYPLVASIFEQCERCKIVFEIICYDDGSDKFHVENNQINLLKNSKYIVLEKNIGRSAIRNKLANDATFEHLLFLDADTMPINDFFIKNYCQYIDETPKIAYGGIKYQEEKPKKDELLRWVYGKEREALGVESRNKNCYLSFLTLNFLIHKSIFKTVRFNEGIPNLRHEDTLFSYNLKQENIKIIHIDNPVYHYGLDCFQKAIKKEKESLSALKYLIDNKLISSEYVGISRVASIIKRFKLIFFFENFHKTTSTIFLKNLASKNPSLFIFDLYRLGYLCQLNN